MKRSASASSLFVVLLLGSASAAAVDDGTKPEQIAFEALARTLVDRLQTDRNAITLQAQAQLYPMALGWLGADRLALADAEDARMDKQVGASSDDGTSLVKKGSVPAILGLAVEAGGLERSQEGSVITLRGNPVGLVRALAGVDPFAARERETGAARFLRKISFAVNFDANGEGTSADSGQLEGYSVRLEMLNRRDPQHRLYSGLWRGFAASAGQRLADELAATFALMITDPEVLAWDAETRRLLPLQDPSRLQAFVADRLKALHDAPVKEATRAAAQRATSTFANTYLLARRQILDLVDRGPLATVEYVNVRRPGLPALSTVNLIGETSLWDGQGDLTANASLTLFDTMPAGASSRVRDLKTGVQLDIRLGDIDRVRSFVLSLAGRYERLRGEPGSAAAPEAIEGNVVVGQLKLTVPTKARGLKIPVSVTVSNRSVAIKEREVRGQVGITLDLDALVAAR